MRYSVNIIRSLFYLSRKYSPWHILFVIFLLPLCISGFSLYFILLCFICFSAFSCDLAFGYFVYTLGFSWYLPFSYNNCTSWFSSYFSFLYYFMDSVLVSYLFWTACFFFYGSYWYFLFLGLRFLCHFAGNCSFFYKHLIAILPLTVLWIFLIRIWKYRVSGYEL